jgi:hypothetical protein
VWLAGVAACSSPEVDVASAVQVTDVTSGWFDAGLDELGRNKLVPTVSLRLENAGKEQLGLLQINGVFRRVGEDTEWGNTLVRAVGTEGLNPGAATDALVLRSPLGYTGEQPRMEMLSHKDFVDVKLELFAKHRSNQWVKLNEYVIERQLLTE